MIDYIYPAARADEDESETKAYKLHGKAFNNKAFLYHRQHAGTGAGFTNQLEEHACTRLVPKTAPSTKSAAAAADTA